MSTMDSSVIREENRRPIMWGLSSVDGITLTPIQISSVDGGLMVEDGTSVMPVMASLPSTMPRDGNRVPCVSGVSSANSSVFIPVSVNPATGAVMIQTT